ncbi:TIGR02466 family protein [Streptomyces sp. NPDC006335]|uniref:TIGR02466 family protein n=1 Tax=Streptomyces sp. NPDC006335 TaxID=3156895 RepID=UPI0033A6FDEE
MKITGEHANLWATPFLVHEVDAPDGYNEALRQLFLERERSSAGTKVGIIDATKTTSDVLRWNDPLIDPLRGWILDVGEAMNSHTGAGLTTTGAPAQMIAEAWAVIYHEWGHHKIHAHHDAAWSGVYYVHTETMEPGTGNLELVDPRPAASSAQPRYSPLTSFTPHSGTLIAFPSWLQHWVTPYIGGSERICVAFNIGFER